MGLMPLHSTISRGDRCLDSLVLSSCIAFCTRLIMLWPNDAIPVLWMGYLGSPSTPCLLNRQTMLLHQHGTNAKNTCDLLGQLSIGSSHRDLHSSCIAVVEERAIQQLPRDVALCLVHIWQHLRSHKTEVISSAKTRQLWSAEYHIDCGPSRSKSPIDHRVRRLLVHDRTQFYEAGHDATQGENPSHRHSTERILAPPAKAFLKREQCPSMEPSSLVPWAN
jgi:hypothetical protein